MAVCIPFLGVTNIEKTVLWYESLGFRCTGSNRYYEPEEELNLGATGMGKCGVHAVPFSCRKK